MQDEFSAIEATEPFLPLGCTGERTTLRDGSVAYDPRDTFNLKR